MDSMPVTVKAEKLVFGGDCIAHVNGKAVFIPYAVPGETLDIEIISSKRVRMHGAFPLKHRLLFHGIYTASRR